MSTHAKLSPSSAKRWMTCPGSIALCETIKTEEKPSRHAAEGTVAHTIGDKCLSLKLEPKSFLGKVMKSDGFKFTVDQEMIDAVDIYVDYVRDLLDDMGPDTELQVEVRCSLKSLGIEGLDGGTSDVVLINNTTKMMAVIDYKHGAGVVVETHDNPQLMSYALGSMLNVDPEFNDLWHVLGVIVQPRAFHPDGPIRCVEFFSGHLKDWMIQDLIPAAEETSKPYAKLIPSAEGCRWCKAVGTCSAAYKMTQEMAIIDFENISELPDATSLTEEQKLLVMKNGAMIKSFIDSVSIKVKEEMDNGSEAYNGSFKLVLKKTNRKFINDAFDPDFSPLFDHLDYSDLFIEKPNTMGNIEKILKKELGKGVAEEIMREVTDKPPGELVVAPLSDKRKAARPSIISDFKTE